MGDDPNDKVWVTSSKDNSETSDTPLNMPLLDDTQIMYTTQKQEQESKKVNRLSMDADLFKSTIKNFENLSGTKPKVSQKNTLSNQSKYQATTLTSQEKQQKTPFNMGSSKKISPKPKAIARPHYKRECALPANQILTPMRKLTLMMLSRLSLRM